MTTRLKAVRLELGWSQSDLVTRLIKQARADKVSVAPATTLKTSVSRWENGHRTPSYFYRGLLRKVTGRTDVELGFTQPPDDPAASTTLGDFLAKIEAARHISAEHVAALQAQVDSLRQLDRPLGAPALLGQVRGLIATTESLLRHAVLGPQRRQIARVLADAAALAGWQALDIGEVTLAWTLFETAKAAAREAEDASLLAYATAEQGYVLLEVGKPGAALDLVRSAGERADRQPGMMRCWLTAAESEVLAAGGAGDGALHGIEKAATLLSSEPGDPLPYLALEEAHLVRWQGNVLARIGHEDATDHLSRALDSMDPRFRRATAGLHCDLAIAATVRGELDLARAHAANALTIAKQIGSLRQVNRVAALQLAG